MSYTGLMLKAICPKFVSPVLKTVEASCRVVKYSCSSRFCSTEDLSSSSGSFVISGTLITQAPVSVGQYAELEHVFTQETVNSFAEICGDNNPLHVDPHFAKGTMFGGTIVHGILVSSLFSTLFGRAINGSIYVSQSVQFKRPVFVGAPVRAKMEVVSIEVRKKGSLLTCTTTCSLLDGTLAVVGEAKVLVPVQ